MSWFARLIGSDDEPAVTSPIDAANEQIAQARVAAFLTSAKNALDGFALLRGEEEEAATLLETWQGRLGKSTSPTMIQQAQANIDEAQQKLDGVKPVREKLEPSIEILKRELGKYHVRLDILTAKSLATQVELLGAEVRTQIARETSDTETPLNKAMTALQEAAAEAKARAAAVEEVAEM